MYNGTEKDYEKLFEIVDKHKKLNSKNFWVDALIELNTFFEVSFSVSVWQGRYRHGKNRLDAYGFADWRLIPKESYDTPIEKEINNEVNIEEKKEVLKTFLIKPKSIEEIQKKLNVGNIQTLGIIQSLKFDGYSIMYSENEKEYSIDRKPLVNNNVYMHSIGKNLEVEFVVISDSHWCQKGQQKSFVNYIYAEADRRHIKNIYHAGDISDGFYKNRPEQIYDLIPGKIGADEQVDYIVNNWPHYDGITTHFIIGNHDETHIINGGCNIGVAIVKGRKDLGYNDFKYLGIGYAQVQLTPNCRMDLFHPLDGSTYAISYSGQKYMDSLSGGDKPNIIFTGHHHKALYFPYRNIHYFEVPSMTKQSSWMKRKRMANESGAWFIKLKVDEEGTIVSLISEHIKQYKFLENDY